MLPLKAARVLWTAAGVAALVVAGFLVWDIGADYAPILSGLLTGGLLANSVGILIVGNVAGIVAALCIIAVWCFLKNRFALVGVICLAFALAIKPHNSGFVWLFFLLAGGAYRKRALQALVVTLALSLPGVLWVSHIAPNWIQEIRTNVRVLSALGGLAPQPTAASSKPMMMLNLQVVVAFSSVTILAFTTQSHMCCVARCS